jgi:hypothetical protein
MQTGMAVAGIVGVVLHAIARKGMQAEGHVEVLRRRPERLVAALFVAVALRGIGDDHGAFETQGRTALEFPHRAVHVPHRNKTEAEQTRGRIGTVLGEQVVVDPEELSLQRGIRDRHQTQGIGWDTIPRQRSRPAPCPAAGPQDHRSLASAARTWPV